MNKKFLLASVIVASVCCIATLKYSYNQSHYDNDLSVYVLSQKKFDDYKDFSKRTFENYSQQGYDSDSSSDWYVLSEAKHVLDDEVQHTDSCIEWAVRNGIRYGVQYTWSTEDAYYSKIYPCNYDENTYPRLQVVNDKLVQISTTSIQPG